MRPVVLAAVVTLLPALLSSAVRAQTPSSAADAVADAVPEGSVQEPTVPDGIMDDLEVGLPQRLSGDDLYWAQVVAQIGAEGLLAPLALCPPVASAVGLLRPGLGALAVDWVGREMGQVKGSQVAALVTSYGMDCGGGLAYTAGYIAAFVPAYLGFLMATSNPRAVQNWSSLMLLSLPGVGLATVGLAVMVARPFVTPLIWGAFVDEVDDSEALPRRQTPPPPVAPVTPMSARRTGVAF